MHPSALVVAATTDPTYSRFNRDEDAQAVLGHPAPAGVTAVQNGEVASIVHLVEAPK